MVAVEDIQPVPAAPLRLDETISKIPVSDVPKADRAPMQATETKAAMRPYSMAVAPSSSLINPIIFANMLVTP